MNKNTFPTLFTVRNPDLFFIKTEQGQKLVDSLLCAKLLLEHSALKHMRIYVDVSLLVIYNPKCGVYESYPRHCVYSIVAQALCSLRSPFSSDYVTEVVDSLLILSPLYSGSPIYERNYISFKNGVFCLSSHKLTEHTPALFINTYFPVVYDIEATCPVFDKYLLTLCVGDRDKTYILLSWLYAFIFKCFDFNVCLLLYGKDFKGMQTFALLCAMLTKVSGGSMKASGSSGSDGVRLNTNPDISLVFNRSFECVSNQQEDFISIDFGEYHGPLIKELPGILNAIIKIGAVNAFNYLITTDFGSIVTKINPTPSQLQTPDALTDSIYSWVRDEVVVGKGAFVGHSRSTELLKQRVDLKGLDPMNKVDLLYPAYIAWCTKVAQTPVSLVCFGKHLLSVLANSGFVVKKVRKSIGYFIYGIGLRATLPSNNNGGVAYTPAAEPSSQELYTPIGALSAPVQLSTSVRTPDETLITPLVQNLDNVAPNANILPPKDTTMPLVNSFFLKENVSLVIPRGASTNSENLYKQYIYLLGETSLKKRLNAFTIKEASFSDNEYSLVAKQLSSDAFFNLPCVSEQVSSIIQKEFSLLKSQGIIACKYQKVARTAHVLSSGISPIITAVKGLVRYNGFCAAEHVLKESNTSIVFLKLSGSLLSILCGLFPLSLKSVIDKIPTSCSESFVMACALTALLGGDNKGLTNSVLDLCCTELSFKKAVLKRDKNFLELREWCSKITHDVSSSELIAALRTLSGRLIDNHAKHALVGPTGFSFELTPHTVTDNFPLFLESFEFFIIARAVIETAERFTKLEVLGHYRDTVALTITSEECSDMESLFRERVLYISNSLGLSYAPTIVTKYKI